MHFGAIADSARGRACSASTQLQLKLLSLALLSSSLFRSKVIVTDTHRPMKFLNIK